MDVVLRPPDFESRRARRSNRSYLTRGAFPKAGGVVLLLLLLTGCAADKHSLGTSGPAQSPLAATEPDVASGVGVTLEEVAAQVRIGFSALNEAGAEAVRCKAYAAADSVGLVGNDEGLRAGADECWAHVEGFMAVAVPLGDALRPYVDDPSSPQEIADLTERTANAFYTMQLTGLSHECRVGTDPNIERCSVDFKVIFSVIQMWVDDLGPAWQAHM